MKVIISDPISNDGIKILIENEIEVINISNKDINDCTKDISNANGWIIRSGTSITRKMINQAPNLSVIGRAGVGIDNIDITQATRKGIVVMNTPDSNTISAAEHTMALILNLSRNINSGHYDIMSGKWNRNKLIGSEIFNKSLGIIGLGKIGREVMYRSLAFNMKVYGYDPYLSEENFSDDDIDIVDLDYLISKSDYITLHMPLTENTKGLFNYNKLSKMKKNARIINVARGGIINEEDLSRLLKENKIAGAAIDVFESEPISSDNPLISAPNIILTPHLGASTKEAKDSVSISICNQVKNYLLKEELDNALNMPFQNFSKLKKMEPVLNLSELLGSIHSQVASGPIKEVEINCFGKVKDTKPIGFSFIRSLLQSRVPERVNYINASVIAKELGIKVNINYSSHETNYTNLISAIVRSDDELILEGSIFDDSLPRLVNIFGYKMEVNPHGTLLLIHNKDVPGVIGKVGSLLGSHNINIAAYLLSRDKHKEVAFAVIRLDQEISSKVMLSLKKIDELKFIRQISINKNSL